MSRWVYALTFLRSVLGIKSGDSFYAHVLPHWAHGGDLLISAFIGMINCLTQLVSSAPF